MAEAGSSREQREKDDPSVDLKIGNGEAVLTFTLSFGGMWKPTFVFTLLSVELEKVDVVEARQKDAEDEIAKLREEVNRLTQKLNRPSTVSLSSTISTTNNQIVPWNVPRPRFIDKNNFALSDDNQRVVILVTGLYQVYVRLAIQNSNGSSVLGLQLNGVDIATCDARYANSHKITAQLSEILELSANDVLQVRCGADTCSETADTANCWNILFLGK